MQHLLDLGLQQGELTGQVAVVTGAGQGIGRELALALAWLGVTVVVAEISETGEDTVRQINTCGGSAIFVNTDVSDEACVKALQSGVCNRHGRVDILVNNAAYSPVISMLESDTALWDRVMAVNLRGTFMTCQAFIPGMLKQKSGVVLNMVSANAMPGMTAYVASKQGIAGFSQSLAAELGNQGVKVVAFGPGIVATPGFTKAAEGLARQGGATADEILSTAMTARHSAAVTAYLIARLAGEYHGEVTDVYSVLDRVSPADATVDTDNNDCAADETDRQLIPVHDAIGQLSVVISQIDQEFNQLPVFVRPIARSQFRKRSGRTAVEWIAALHSLSNSLKAGGLQGTTQGEWYAALDRLLAYCQAVPRETARFTKDQATLDKITRITQEREALIRQFKVML